MVVVEQADTNMKMSNLTIVALLTITGDMARLAIGELAYRVIPLIAHKKFLKSSVCSPS